MRPAVATPARGCFRLPTESPRFGAWVVEPSPDTKYRRNAQKKPNTKVAGPEHQGSRRQPVSHSPPVGGAKGRSCVLQSIGGSPSYLHLHVEQNGGPVMAIGRCLKRIRHDEISRGGRSKAGPSTGPWSPAQRLARRSTERRTTRNAGPRNQPLRIHQDL